MDNSKLWKRKCKIYIKATNNAVSDIAVDISNLKCLFTIEKKLGGFSIAKEMCTFEVYNVNPETEKIILKDGYGLTIEAGYENGRYGKIFEGDIIQAVNTIEEENFKITILAMSGQEEIASNFVKCSTNSSTRKEQLKIMGQKARIPIQIEDKTEDYSTDNELPRGKVFFNSVEKYYSDYGRRMGNIFFYLDSMRKKTKDSTETEQKAKIVIQSLMNVISNMSAIELSPETGLIGIPQVCDNGVIIKCLLDPRLTIEGYVKLKDSMIQRGLVQPFSGQGFNQTAMIDPESEYKIYSIKHMGDTYGDTWISEVIGVGRNHKLIDTYGVAQ